MSFAEEQIESDKNQGARNVSAKPSPLPSLMNVEVQEIRDLVKELGELQNQFQKSQSHQERLMILRKLKEMEENLDQFEKALNS